MRTSREWMAVGLAAVLILTGCGGGSGGGVSAPVAAQSAASAEAAASASSVQPTQPQSSAASASAGTAAVARAGTEPTRFIEGGISNGVEKTDVSPFVIRDAKDAPTARQIRLGVLSASDVPVEKAVSGGPIPVRIGQGRTLSDTADNARVAALLDWKPSRRGGKVAALRFQSEGALGVRVGLRVHSLPLGGLVRFHTDGSSEAYQVATQEIQSTIQRNLDAGDTGEHAHTWWSPNLGGDAITVEFEVPPGVPTDTVEVAIPALSHIYLDAKDVASIQKAGGSCSQDVNCFGDPTVSATSQSVAQLNFLVGTSSYLCTGTLLNDDKSSGTPYLLTANHCISSQTSASSLWTYWFYRSASCNSPTIAAAATQTKAGATLLYNSSHTDTSFLRLNGAPPAGVRYAASAPGGLSGTTSVFSIHHPGGDYQKYSEGVSTGPAATCGSAYGPSNCSIATPSNFLKVNWNVGTTLSGSSGGGLFMKVNGAPYLVGQLYGGYSSCTAPNDNEYFGRFDVAYNAALYQWLGGTPTTTPSTPATPGSHVPIYRFYNTKTGTHFYTVSAAERDSVRAKYPQYSYEGIGFYADASQSGSTTPVYRFYNTKTGAHFFTVSAQERDQVRAKYAQFSYEGVAWYVNGAAGGAASPMYRFYNVQTETHFYTISGTERASVIAKYPQFHDEGIAYYAWTSP